MGVVVMQTADQLNAVTEQVIGAAVEVHRAIRPGLLESAYEICLVYELRERGFRVEQQKALPVVYKGVQLDCGYRLDIVVNECVIVEVKAVEKLTTVHDRAAIILSATPELSGWSAFEFPLHYAEERDSQNRQ
jgi:GxxExxY protein